MTGLASSKFKAMPSLPKVRRPASSASHTSTESGDAATKKAGKQKPYATEVESRTKLKACQPSSSLPIAQAGSQVLQVAILTWAQLHSASGVGVLFSAC